MIVCKSCGFNINGNMKFAIKSNKCPCCGANLFENEELKKIKKISSELLNNGFKFKQEVLRNLSIFIIKKISSISKKVEVSEEEFDFNEPLNDDLDFEDQQFDSDQEYETLEKNLTEDTFSENSFSDDNDNNDDDRVDRLKRLAKENAILNKRGASVRRIGD